MSNVTRKFRTTVGTARYPHLTRPDTKFEPPFKTGFIQSPDDAQPLIDIINEVAEEAFKPAQIKKANIPYEIDEETGDVVFTTKSGYQPGLFAGNGDPIKDKVREKLIVGGGSQIKLSLTVKAWEVSGKCGIKLELRTVQIVKPVSSGGFDAEEGGWVPDEDDYADDDTAPANDQDTDEDAADEDEDF
ncbi:hypothetical protein [Pyruvatibacter sp.]